MARVLKPAGTAVVLLPDELLEEAAHAAARAGLEATESYPVRRARMTAQALVFQRRQAARRTLDTLLRVS